MTSSAIEHLRSRLSGPDIIVLAGCHDGLSAKLLADAGHTAAFMSGFAVAGARLCVPDTGLISFSEMVDTLRACVEAAPSLAIIADGDNGYGNAINVERTVRAYARAGAAAIMIEDQVMPKATDGAAGKQVISRHEAVIKVRAACEAARDAGILILARTDARSVLGFDEAKARCLEFVGVGADIIYADSLASEQEMRVLCAEVACPVMANVLVGMQPALTPQSARALGFRLIATPHALLAAAAHAMRQAAVAALPGVVSEMPGHLRFEELKTMLGFEQYQQRLARLTANSGGK